MPLLRITCPPELTERIVHLLHTDAQATQLAVIAEASRISGGDLVLADVPRASIDDLLAHLPAPADPAAMHVAVVPSEHLWPLEVRDERDDDAVVWAQVQQEVHSAGRLSWLNLLLIVVAACIAAIGILQDQLLLIVGAMALSPDYYPIADTCLALSRGAWSHVAKGLATLTLSFSAAAVGAWALTAVLSASGLVDSEAAPSRQLTLFIERPDWLSVVVALLAGVAGALAITLPDARGLVGVFVSITTIPAAANIGVALANRDRADIAGAAVQLLVNVGSLIFAGTITLAVRHKGRWATAQRV